MVQVMQWKSRIMQRYGADYNFRWVEAPTSHIPAHTTPAAVAPFRAWPSSQVSVAGGPMGASIDSLSLSRTGRIIY